MNQVKDMMLLALMAGRQGRYEDAAKLFGSCLSAEGIDGFIDELSSPGPNAQTDNVDDADNTIAPALASVMPIDTIISMASDMESCASYSGLIQDLEEFETYVGSASDDSDDSDESDEMDVAEVEDEDESDDEIVVVAAVGPVGIR